MILIWVFWISAFLAFFSYFGYPNHLEFLNIFKFGLFSYEYLCHKLMRWLVPVFLLVALISGATLIGESALYRFLFALQIVFYFSALIGIVLPVMTKIVLIRIPSFFVVVNASIFVAWLKFFKGERVTLWQPSVR